MDDRGDLLGHRPPQGTLFGAEPDRIPDPPAAASYLPDPEDVRQRLYAVLRTAKASERMPWDARKARMWQTVFPQMANWLPEDEANQLRFEFAQEIERLQQAA